MAPEENKRPKPRNEVDIFRDTNLRYMGYANEIGESFRALISPAAVRATYGIAFGYVFMDVVDKTIKTYKESSLQVPQKDSPVAKASKVGIDCLLWQTFASVLIPGFTINRICKLSSFLMIKSNIQPLVRANKILTTGIGLASIPFIIHPIDHLCHVAMDKSVRPALGIEPHLKEKKDSSSQH